MSSSPCRRVKRRCESPFCRCSQDATFWCSKCCCIWYCSTTCQKRDWKSHKNECIPKEEQAKCKVANEALVSSSGRGHLIAVRDLLEKHKANVNYVSDKGFTALYAASHENHPVVIDVLVAAGARLDWRHAVCGLTALHSASQKGHLQAVASLVVRACADPNVRSFDDNTTPIMIAAQHGNAIIVSLLFKNGARINGASPIDGATALHLASENGHMQAVHALICFKANMNVVTTEWASSPLMLAAFKGHAFVVDALATAGARVNYARPKDGVTALILASQEGQLQAVSSLIRANADPNQVTTDEWALSPLMVAALKGHTHVVNVLIAGNAHVNYASPKDGVTAVMLASGRGNFEAVVTLLLAKADPCLALHDGRTALYAAKRNKHTAVIALLEARIAELAASP